MPRTGSTFPRSPGSGRRPKASPPRRGRAGDGARRAPFPAEGPPGRSTAPVRPAHTGTWNREAQLGTCADYRRVYERYERVRDFEDVTDKSGWTFWTYVKRIEEVRRSARSRARSWVGTEQITPATVDARAGISKVTDATAAALFPTDVPVGRRVGSQPALGLG